MKKALNTVSILVLMMSFVMSSQAQVSFGVKAGLNMYTLNQALEDEDDEISLSYRPGIHLGVVANVPLKTNLSLKTGLTFITKGANFDLESEFEDTEDITVEGGSYFNFMYLEIPIHLDYQKNNFHIFGGPYIGLGLAGKAVSDYTISGGGIDFTVDEEVSLKPAFGEVNDDDFADNEDAFNGLDLGLNLGVGYQVGPILISLDYSLGFGNIIPTYEGQTEDDDKLRNRGINLSGTYMF